MRHLPALGILAFFISLVLTPLVCLAARRYGLVDKADGVRKLHAGGATPLGGGLAVLASLVAALLLFAAWPRPLGAALAGGLGQLGWLLAAALVVAAVGLADDLVGLRGRQKLLGQTVAAAVVVTGGLTIQNVHFFRWEVDLGVLAVPFTLFWLLGAINALNLIDGADGMAATVGAILSLTIAFMAALTGHRLEAAVAVALGGSLLGFLVYNFPPAKIFLGDVGSMLVGLILGALAIRSSLKGPATAALTAPLAVFAIPIFDAFIAILRRRLTGRSIYATDRGHLHHRLLQRGLSNRAMLLCVALLCAGTAAGALLSVWAHNEIFALLCAGAVIGSLVASRAFGSSELALLAARAVSLSRSFVPTMDRNGGPAGADAGGRGRSNGRARKKLVRLQGSRDWRELWDALTDFAERHQLAELRLDVYVAWLQEEFVATWEQPERLAPDQRWTSHLPLLVDGREVGRLQVAGPLGAAGVYPLLGLLAELLESMETVLKGLAGARSLAGAERSAAAGPAEAEAWRKEPLPNDQ